ncbi:orotidine-5'-phosphate decarboxylase [Lactobacillus terrae]|uniref:orotidine-5'-phosphate decarboxylase n=1 Tax=Lactobacillus terrae TaxID=2269374 RepID=UPI000C1B7311|nr:orotidine-5'-phosphate decarboxylase [Lactobacillus terrae]
MINPLILALDFSTDEEAISFIDSIEIDKDNTYLKIGLEMFCKYGYPFIQKIQNLGYKIFLDIKLHDIPNTVERTCKMISEWNIQMITVHATGGSEMILAAKKGLEGSDTKLLAVTQLTSLDDKNLSDELQVNLTSQDYVRKLAELAYKNNADGVISSALEVPIIKEATNNSFICITPGIRVENSENEDQKRVVTPMMAKELGSNGIVVGRPITQSDDRNKAYKKFYESWVNSNG